MVNPRKWLLASTPQVSISAALEECNKHNYPESKYEKTKPRVLEPKQAYQGDRFIPCRRGYNFERAHCLLTKESDSNKQNNEDIYMLDVCKQVEMLDVTYRREAMRTMMLKQTFVSGLSQSKILHFSCPAAQFQNSKKSSRNALECKEDRRWKCRPRKRALIGNVEKILCMPDFPTSESDNINLIDWSCHELIAMGKRNCVKIYNGEGSTVATWNENGRPSIIKWSNDGSKLAICIKDIIKFPKIILYDIEKKKPIWNAICHCIYRPQLSIYELINNECTIRCVCWSLHDRHVITGCSGRISVYASDTGKLLHTTAVPSILTMSLSPNYKYLVATMQDCAIRLFIWPEMIPHIDMFFLKCVKAVAWHPETSGLLCIGTTNNGALVLCNANKCTMSYTMTTKFCATVENLLWNKLSGELLVHWNYRKRDKRYTVVPVLARFDRIVDVLPFDKEAQLSFMRFNATHDKLIAYGDDTISIWNFFGNEKPPRERCLPLYSSAWRRQGVIVHNPIR